MTKSPLLDTHVWVSWMLGDSRLSVRERTVLDEYDRLADLVPPPRKHRHRRRDAATGGDAVGGHAADGDATADCCDSCDKPASHATFRIAWVKLMARVGEEFPVACPGCGGDIRRRVDRRQEPAHFEPEVRKREKASGPPADWGELV